MQNIRMAPRNRKDAAVRSLHFSDYLFAGSTQRGCLIFDTRAGSDRSETYIKVENIVTQGTILLHPSLLFFFSYFPPSIPPLFLLYFLYFLLYSSFIPPFTLYFLLFSSFFPPFFLLFSSSFFPPFFLTFFFILLLLFLFPDRK